MGYEEIMNKADVENVPISVLFELTNKCNLNCIHCYIVKEKRRELTTEEIKSILDQLADSGTLFLILSGGEVLTRDDFFEIAGYARKKEFAIRIFTNGTLIDEEIADKLKNLNPLSVEISTHSMDNLLFDSITRVPGSAYKVFRAIELLKKRKINVVMKVLLMKQTFKEFGKLNKFRRKMGLGLDYSSNITVKNDCSTEPIQYRLTDEQLKELGWGFLSKYSTKELLEEVGLFSKEIPRYIIPCRAAAGHACISPYGDVYPCVQLVKFKAGNLREKSFEEIWRKSKELKKIRKLKKIEIKECKQCEFKAHCSFCPGQALLESGSFVKPFPESCTMAGIYANTIKEIVQRRRKN